MHARRSQCARTARGARSPVPSVRLTHRARRHLARMLLLALLDRLGLDVHHGELRGLQVGEHPLAEHAIERANLDDVAYRTSDSNVGLPSGIALGRPSFGSLQITTRFHIELEAAEAIAHQAHARHRLRQRIWKQRRNVVEAAHGRSLDHILPIPSTRALRDHALGSNFYPLRGPVFVPRHAVARWVDAPPVRSSWHSPQLHGLFVEMALLDGFAQGLDRRASTRTTFFTSGLA